MSNQPAVPDPRELRASNADRERVAKILHTAMAEGRLTVSELEERLDSVYAAKTFGELVPLTADLPVNHADLPAQPMPAVAQTSPRLGGRGTSNSAIAIMSGAERKGPWTVPPTFNAVAIMGGVDIDLTQARFEDRETTIQAFAFWGGITIVVPADIVVRVSGSGFMGAFDDHAHQADARPGAPVLRITGLAVMGGIEVKRWKPSKRERRLAEEQRRQLEE